MAIQRRVRTGDMLLEMGVVTPAQLEIGLTQQKMIEQTTGRRTPIGEILVRNRFVRREEVEVALERSTEGVSTAGILPIDFCAKMEIDPYRVEGDTLWVRAARPLRPGEMDQIRLASDGRFSDIKVVAADRVSIAEVLAKSSARRVSFSSMVVQLQSDDSGQVLRATVDALFSEALTMRASDIHLDSKPDPESWVSYRIDGVLRQKHLLPHKIMAAIVTRIKSDSSMDASNTISPQDGRITVEHQGRSIDFRVASQPIAGGETLALRSLDAEALPSHEMMFPNQPEIIQLFRRLSQAEGKKGGIVLVTGPTGSGKTTTLYSLIRMLPRDAVNLMTVEDPVEYSLPFGRQIQLNALLGQKAGDFERSLLRQDPDIIMMGEIRDDKSASAALKFAESGHMVLSTMHADGVAQVFERTAGFFEGASKEEALYVLSQHLHVVLHQHLMPRLCDCATPQPEADQVAFINKNRMDWWMTPSAKGRVRKGCIKCGGTGLTGRVLSHETMVIPRSADVRHEVSRVLATGVINATQITKVSGVTYVSRRETIQSLFDGGVIDLETAMRGAL